jgi:Ca2+-transporting ATPase
MREMVEEQIEAFASKGFRVLGMASRLLPEDIKQFDSEIVEKDLTFLGLAALFDPPRPLIQRAVSEARSAGIQVIMVTGDREESWDRHIPASRSHLRI